MEQKRVFLAATPDAATLAALLAFQARLPSREPFQSGSNACRWLPGEDLHLTLHFIGGLPLAQVPPLAEGLSEVASVVARHLQPLDELVAFPEPRHARVGALGCRQIEPLLQQLWEKLATFLRSLQLPVEDRPFFPHVSLVRFRRPLRFSRAPASDPIFFPVSSVTLFETRSPTENDGPRYLRLAEFPLAPGTPP